MATIEPRHREPVAKVGVTDNGQTAYARPVTNPKPLSLWTKLKLGRAILKTIRDPIMINKLKSRKLWVAVGVSAAAALFTQLGFSSSLIDQIVSVGMMYIGGEAAVDAARAFKTPAL